MDGFSAVNTIWVLVGAALVFFMQAGFAMVETGFTRAKNAGNIIMKNLMDFAIGTPLFWLLGFGLMFGGAGALIGGFDPLVQGDYSSILPDGVPLPAFLIFQTVFCATAATIVSGAMAERTKFAAYCIYSAAISLVIYPISGHWIWGGGWLAQMGFHDFAGSTAVHMVGGVAALVGAKILGPRIGKYDKNGKPRAIPGHSLTLGALGVFILWFCWFGFNGGSTVSMTGDDTIFSAGSIFVTTNLAAAVSTVANYHDHHLDPLWKAGCLYDLKRRFSRPCCYYRRLRCRQSCGCLLHRPNRLFRRGFRNRICRQGSED